MTKNYEQASSSPSLSGALARRLSTAVSILRSKGLVYLILAVVFRCQAPLINKLVQRLCLRKIQELAKCLGSKPVCIYVATGDFNNPLLQRQQHVVRELSRLVPVVYVSPRQGFDRFLGFKRINEHLYLSDNLEILLAAFPYATVMLLSVDNRLPKLMEILTRHPGRIVYDYIDALDASVDRLSITPERHQAHERLLNDPSTLIIASARMLYEDVAYRRNSGLALITNGVDPEHYRVFPSWEGLTKSYQAILAQKRPILGYFGALAEWIDYALLIRLARQRPDINVVLIGIDYDGSLRRHRHLFPENLHVHPRVDYNILPHYAAHFSASLIPFVLNNVTQATSPLKLFEYMSLGKPIISTAIPEARSYASPLVAESSDEFISLVDKALTLRNDPHLQATMAAEAEANSWKHKAAEIATFCGLIPEGEDPSRLDVASYKVC